VAAGGDGHIHSAEARLRDDQWNSDDEELHIHSCSHGTAAGFRGRGFPKSLDLSPPLGESRRSKFSGSGVDVGESGALERDLHPTRHYYVDVPNREESNVDSNDQHIIRNFGPH
jgi:hypothetical protein